MEHEDCIHMTVYTKLFCGEIWCNVLYNFLAQHHY